MDYAQTFNVTYINTSFFLKLTPHACELGLNPKLLILKILYTDVIITGMSTKRHINMSSRLTSSNIAYALDSLKA